MGREIRRVPPHWEHPRHTMETASRSNLIGEYIPLFDRDYEEKAQEWLDECIQWTKGEHPHQSKGFYWEYAGNPPDPENYRPKFTQEPTWYQVYETVTEGTPVTPPFETKEELAHYLSTHGDFAYQKGYSDISPKPTYKQAMKFIESAWALSMIVQDGKIKSNYEAV